MEIITNRLAKKITGLLTKKGREEFQQFIIEGEKFVDEITDQWDVECYVVSASYAEGNSLDKYEERSKVYVAGDALYNKISDTVTPQGIMAVCHIRKWNINEMDLCGRFFVYGECISDPGNAGTLLRTADAAGAGAFMLSRESVDIYSPKIMRSCAGSIFHLPVMPNADAEMMVKVCKDQSVKLVAAVVDGEYLPYDIDMTACCILIGNEARGLTESTRKNADYSVRLPMPGMAESLNAGVAGGILMYEAVRQRLLK